MEKTFRLNISRTSPSSSYDNKITLKALLKLYTASQSCFGARPSRVLYELGKLGLDFVKFVKYL